MSLDNCFLIRFLQSGNYSFLGKALPMLVRPLYDAAKQVTGVFKGNQKGNIKCYARERANTKQPF